MLLFHLLFVIGRALEVALKRTALNHERQIALLQIFAPKRNALKKTALDRTPTKTGWSWKLDHFDEFREQELRKRKQSDTYKTDYFTHTLYRRTEFDYDYSKYGEERHAR